MTISDSNFINFQLVEIVRLRPCRRPLSQLASWLNLRKYSAFKLPQMVPFDRLPIIGHTGALFDQKWGDRVRAAMGDVYTIDSPAMSPYPVAVLSNGAEVFQHLIQQCRHYWNLTLVVGILFFLGQMSRSKFVPIS